MSKIIPGLFFKVSSLSARIGNKLAGPAPSTGIVTNEMIQAERCKPWFAVEGDKNLRVNYDLSDSSLVIDLGGYEGQWASDIYAMYNCNVWIFEPYKPFAKNIENRFRKNQKVKTFDFGLGSRDEQVGFAVSDNSSSMFLAGKGDETIQIRSVSDFFREQGVEKVDLLKINIEGAEYDLLESMLDHRLVNKVVNIQVQFHDFIIENAAARMKAIQKRLAETHELSYQYEFVWENWVLKR